MKQDDPLGPELVTSTARTTETSRPAEVHQIIAAELVSREEPLKFAEITRVILHDPSYYLSRIHESSAYLDGREWNPLRGGVLLSYRMNLGLSPTEIPKAEYGRLP